MIRSKRVLVRQLHIPESRQDKYLLILGMTTQIFHSRWPTEKKFSGSESIKSRFVMDLESINHKIRYLRDLL